MEKVLLNLSGKDEGECLAFQRPLPFFVIFSLFPFLYIFLRSGKLSINTIKQGPFGLEIKLLIVQ